MTSYGPTALRLPAFGGVAAAAVVVVASLLDAAACLDLRCKGVPDGSAGCTGCSPEFNGDACGACLMETFDAAPTCTACEAERPSGDPVTVECGPSCFYCRSCDLRSGGGGSGGDLVEMRTPGGAVVETCRCNATGARAAAAAAQGGGGAAAKGPELLDGTYGVVQVQPDQSTVTTLDGLRVRVTCAKVGRDRYRTAVVPLDGRGGGAAPLDGRGSGAAPPARTGGGRGDTCVERGNTYRVVPWSGCSLFVQRAGAISEVHACPPTTAFDVQTCTCAHRLGGMKCCV